MQIGDRVKLIPGYGCKCGPYLQDFIRSNAENHFLTGQIEKIFYYKNGQDKEYLVKLEHPIRNGAYAILQAEYCINE